jgi:hypothetical protein
MPSKTIPIRRLFNGLASVRDYVIEKCYREGKDIIFVLNNEKMTIPNEELNSRSFQLSEKKFISKFNGKPYTLIDFKFKPDKETNQESMFD